MPGENPTKTRDAALLQEHGVTEPRKGSRADMAWGDRRGVVGPERVPDGEVAEPLRPPIGDPRRLT